MVNVGKLMTPKDMVATCYPSDTIESVLEMATKFKEGAVVVLHEHGMLHIPVGIVSKTDLLEAYKDNVPKTDKVREIMSHMIETIPDTANKDTAIEHFQRTRHHHAFVINKDSQWGGLLSVWDLAFETAREDRAWPWNLQAVDYFMSHASPRMKLKHDFAQTEKHELAEPSSFVGVAEGAK